MVDVREFERDFAEFCEAPFYVGMASGTDALRFALIAAGVRAGDTVVTVAISQAGARADLVGRGRGGHHRETKRETGRAR